MKLKNKKKMYVCMCVCEGNAIPDSLNPPCSLANKMKYQLMSYNLFSYSLHKTGNL